MRVLRFSSVALNFERHICRFKNLCRKPTGKVIYYMKLKEVQGIVVVQQDKSQSADTPTLLSCY